VEKARIRELGSSFQRRSLRRDVKDNGIDVRQEKHFLIPERILAQGICKNKGTSIGTR